VKREIFSQIAGAFFQKSTFSSASIFNVAQEFKYYDYNALDAPWGFNNLVVEAIVKGFAEDEFKAAFSKISSVLLNNKESFKSKRQQEIQEFGREKFHELVKKLCGSHYQFNADELKDMVDEFRVKDLLEK
jgi:hypothetical protein